jgi:hypothetical protein
MALHHLLPAPAVSLGLSLLGRLALLAFAVCVLVGLGLVGYWVLEELGADGPKPLTWAVGLGVLFLAGVVPGLVGLVLWYVSAEERGATLTVLAGMVAGGLVVAGGLLLFATLA